MKNVSEGKGLTDIIINGELDPYNDIVSKLTNYIKTKIDTDLEKQEKTKTDKSVDPNDLKEDINSLNSRINSVILEIGDKIDKPQLQALEESLNHQIQQVRSKTSVKITSMEDLADNETLHGIFSELIDNRYKEYEKSLSKVYAKMDKVEGDVER